MNLNNDSILQMAHLALALNISKYFHRVWHAVRVLLDGNISETFSINAAVPLSSVL